MLGLIVWRVEAIEEEVIAVDGGDSFRIATKFRNAHHYIRIHLP